MPKPGRLPSLLPYLLLLVAFGYQVFALQTPVSSQALLEQELVLDQSGAEPLYARPPFCYRVVFPLLVDGVSMLLGGDGQTFVTGGERFYLSFVGVSLLCWALALFGVTRLLRLLQLRPAEVLFGQLAFVTAFGVVRAYGYPCHTREDPLAYALLALGLCCWIERRYVGLLLLSVLAAATREPTLVLPGAFLLLGDLRWPWRVGMLAAPVATMLLLRAGIGYEPHPVVEGTVKMWTTQAEESALGALFGFGWMWGTCALLLARRALWPDNRAGQLLGSSLRVVFPVMMLAAALGAIIREFRLVFVLAPWVVPLTTALVARWLRLRDEAHLSRAVWSLALLFVALAALPLLAFDGGDPELLPARWFERYAGYSWAAWMGFQLVLVGWLAWASRGPGSQAVR